MTGYGQGSSGSEGIDYQIEMRSVNHRYLDVNIRLSQTLSPLEDKIREGIRKEFQRGRLDIFVSRRQLKGEKELQVDEEIAGDYVRVVRQLAHDHSLPIHLNAEDLVALPGVVTAADYEVKIDQEWEIMKPALEKAINSLKKQRLAEGKRLKKDMQLRLELIENARVQIADYSPRVIAEHRQRIEQQIQELLKEVPPDQNRLLMETAILAEKISITEELVRLESHCKAMGEDLNLTDPVGRKMDFILQEMNREVNTISSKSQDYEIARLVVEIKSQLEKLREQVQNIE